MRWYSLARDMARANHQPIDAIWLSDNESVSHRRIVDLTQHFGHRPQHRIGEICVRVVPHIPI